MGATTKCSSCGITIRLGSPNMPEVIAKGDRFWHVGCIEAHTDKYAAGVPAYHIPRSW